MNGQAHRERDRLRYFLDQQRKAVLAIIDGLDESQLRTPVLPSGWTPIGLVLHLAGAEAQWFQRVALGTQPQVTWDDGILDPAYDPSAPFTTDHSSDAVYDRTWPPLIPHGVQTRVRDRRHLIDWANERADSAAIE